MTTLEATMAYIGLLLGGGLGLLAIAGADPEGIEIDPELRTATWVLPSCPAEITLQDGSRWALTQWERPGCKAVIGWNEPPMIGVPSATN